jgi:hypothetical protein
MDGPRRAAVLRALPREHTCHALCHANDPATRGATRKLMVLEGE